MRWLPARCIVFAIMNGRRQRKRFGFPLRPVWAEAALAAIGSAAVLGATWVVNSYPWPFRLDPSNTRKHNNVTIPPGVEDRDGDAICMAADKVVRCTEGLIYYTGYADSGADRAGGRRGDDLHRQRARAFGRYVYAIGGNPEAAELAGINTKALTVKVFALMGVLVGDLGDHRLGPSRCRHQCARPAQRTLRHRRGGDRRHFAGRRYRHDLRRHARRAADAVAAVGHGAAEPAESAFQNIVVGTVLVLAVFVDQLYRRRVK